MNPFYDSGAGSPTFDSGAGDPISYTGFAPGPQLSLGAGDPSMLYHSLLLWTAGWKPWRPGSPMLSQLRYPDDDKVSWMGGHMVAVATLPFALVNAPYRVDLLDSNNQPHPLDEPGCYSAVEGGGSEIYPEPDATTLIFSTPPLPPGLFTIRITDSLNQTVTLEDALEVVLDLDCFETDSIRSGLDPKVYPGAHPDKDFDVAPEE